ncbi:hypothetical protein U8D42_07810 [Mycobacterium europaeum]|uniref:hypothetical protein n=1 Tax=Mycobacterium europaeum TaxID=761804 RepID=UPI002AE03BC1|nr:hypothetical protein [Mycobacterium europaeum]MEA1161471.1 hypothetical protein [Mycobacterium europaeum]
MTLEKNDPEIRELIARFNKWREIYSLVGEPPPDEATWEEGRLYLRFGYPHPDWWAYILGEDSYGLYSVIRGSTERSRTLTESPKGSFSRLRDAGKFLIYEVAEWLRISRRMEPVSWRWDDAGLDPQVDQVVHSDKIVKYSLRSDSDAYFIMARGDVAYSHLLPLSYEELDAQLIDGFPDSVASRLRIGSR